ncbi:MAG: redoxin domain-containing protein [Erysipelotrichaceae bacterium]|nr:redoxin domain-containing protein [Erysipelotrichaceae bacterium]
METITTLGLMFTEGLMSFFSPCVLPLVPLYFGYLTTNAKSVDEDGKVVYKRSTVIINTIFFILGISTVILLAAITIQSVKSFFEEYTTIISMFGGICLLFFGLMALKVINVPFLEQEHRLNSKVNYSKMSFLKAYLMGFIFSFSWTPCIGPMLSSALVMSATASSASLGYAYIGAYLIGFTVVFLLCGLFVEEVLKLLKEHQSIVKYTEMIGGALILCMGIYTLFNVSNEIINLQRNKTSEVAESTTTGDTPIEQYSFTAYYADGTPFVLADKKGEAVCLTFFRTWCTYCSQEITAFDELIDEYPDMNFYLITNPNDPTEKDIDGVEEWMKENNHKVTVLYDMSGTIESMYGVSGYPYSFLYKADGSVVGYIPGYLEKQYMMEAIEDTLNMSE